MVCAANCFNCHRCSGQEFLEDRSIVIVVKTTLLGNFKFKNMSLCQRCIMDPDLVFVDSNGLIRKNIVQSETVSKSLANGDNLNEW